MLNLHRDYKRDYVEVERALREGEPFCLVRFNDGEFALLNGQKYKAASGWKVQATSGRRLKTKPDLWIRAPLTASLSANLPGYHIGISPPCCLPAMVLYYRRAVQVPPSRVTFATLFFNANFARAVRFFRELNGIMVGCGEGCDYRVPADGVNQEWDIDAMVTKLLDEADRPVLLAAGPSACIIGHRYWERALERQTSEPGFRPQPIVDVGATLDQVIHGRRTRTYHDANSPLRGHVCVWNHEGIRSSGLTAPNAAPRGHVVNRGMAPRHIQSQHPIHHGATAAAMSHRDVDIAAAVRNAPTPGQHRAKLKKELVKEGQGIWAKQSVQRRVRNRVRRPKSKG